MMLWHAVDLHGKTPRHFRARKTWQDAYATGRVTPLPRLLMTRNAHTSLGDPRALPFLKDILSGGLLKEPQDGVVWTNDDIAFGPGLVPYLEAHLAQYPAVTMRRDTKHVGRDLFAFRVSWLTAYWDMLPDYVQGASDFDLGVAAFVRWSHDLKHSTFANLLEDWFPADALERHATHEDHGKGAWEGGHLPAIPSTRHNRRLFRQWAEAHQPKTRFTTDGVIC